MKKEVKDVKGCLLCFSASLHHKCLIYSCSSQWWNLWTVGIVHLCVIVIGIQASSFVLLNFHQEKKSLIGVINFGWLLESAKPPVRTFKTKWFNFSNIPKTKRFVLGTSQYRFLHKFSRDYVCFSWSIECNERKPILERLCKIQ